MNKIIWYRDTVFKNFCYVTIDNNGYLVNIYGLIECGRHQFRRYIEAADEKELIELNEYKILKQHVLKLTSNLYQELLK